MKLITAIFLAAMATTVQAARIPITVDFNSGGNVPPFNVFQGFRFVNECPSASDSFWPDPSGDGTFWASGFCQHHDPDTDPTLEPQVIVTRLDHRPFTFLGFDSPSHNIRVQSSRGGEVWTDSPTFCLDPEFDPPDCQWDLTTDLPATREWRNVRWVSLCPDGCQFADHATGLYDNLRFSIQVPEPAPLTLIGIALVGLAFIRRRAMSIA